MKNKIKQTEKTVIKTIYEYSCDICNDIICTNEYSHVNNSTVKCLFCDRDVCDKCKLIRPEDERSDYPSFYCTECWERGKSFRDDIDYMEGKIDIIMAEWERQCKKKKK